MILLYHNIIPTSTTDAHKLTQLTLQQSAFENQMKWLAARFHLVSLEEHLKTSGKRKQIAITFDDGTATSFACAFPILQRLNIPATFFVTTCHLEEGDLMPGWYLNALFFENIYPEVRLNGQICPLGTAADRLRSRQMAGRLAQSRRDPLQFVRDLEKEYPLPAHIRSWYQGMSFEQLKTAAESSLVEIGAHTHNHPNLKTLSVEKQAWEIAESRNILASASGKPVRYFAYPSGAYTRQTIDLVKGLGYAAACAVIPLRAGDDPLFEVERVGVYSPSLIKLWMKSIGVANRLRRMGVRVG